MKIVMRYIECVARRQNCWLHTIRDRTNENVNNMWEEIGNRFIIDPFSKKTGEEKKHPGKQYTTGWLWQKNSPKKAELSTLTIQKKLFLLLNVHPLLPELKTLHKSQQHKTIRQ